MKNLLVISALLMFVSVQGASKPLPWQELTAAARWNCVPFGKCSTRDGRDFVMLRSDDRRKAVSVTTLLDVKEFLGQAVNFSIRVRAKEVSRPGASWNGVKFMLHTRDFSGKENWYNSSGLYGTFDWKEANFSATLDNNVATARLVLGLQDSSGEVEFDLSSLKVAATFPRVESGYIARYSPEVAAMPPLRGVMSPAVHMTDDDFNTLKAWNANLIRFQITRNWGKDNRELDLAEYDKWLNGRLDDLESILGKAEKAGIRIVVDLHAVPGGRRDGEHRMFFERRYADHFVEVWKRIATRFRGQKAIWAYDLFNEPSQKRPSTNDYLSVQRAAAIAIREIDPEIPIIISSNTNNCPATFSYLAPVELENIIYQVHMYQPGNYTHQGVFNTWGEKGAAGVVQYPGMINGIHYDKEVLRRELEMVRAFQQRHKARIFVGEFSVAAWAPNAEQYLNDCIELFEEYGWDWTYHAFREYEGWSVEHAGMPRRMKKCENTPRKAVLLNYFKRNRNPYMEPQGKKSL